MKSLYLLEAVLAASVDRKGEVPLTNAHLRNIVKMAIRAEEAREERIQRALDEVLNDDKIWGSS